MLYKIPSFLFLRVVVGVSRYPAERARVYRGVPLFSFAVILQAEQAKQAQDKNPVISRLFSP